MDDYLIEKYNLFRFLQLESEGRGGQYGGIRVVPREGRWEQAKIKQLKVYPKAVHIWKSAMTNQKFRMPQNIFGLKKLRTDVRNVFERLVHSEGNLRVLRLESRVELKGKVQDACAEAYVAAIHALNKICIYELPFQQVVSVSTKLLVGFKNRFKGANATKLDTERKCLAVAMASMIGVWSVGMNRYFHNHSQRYMGWYRNIVVGEANIMPENYFYQEHILDSVANYNTHCIVGPDLQF